MDNQINLTYQGRKQAIKTELNRVSESFVVIGYQLKQIRDSGEYIQDGYSNINEFAKAEYNLSQSSTSRFIAINDNFSLGGSSPKLLERYEDYGYSKLSEMLTLTEEEMKLISVRTTVADIRGIKEAKKEAEKSNYATSHNDAQSLETTQFESDSYEQKRTLIPEAEKLLIDFFRDKARKNILKELKVILANGTNTETVAKAAEVINPSGHLMYRKIITILMFEEDHIKYSKMGATNQDFSYADLLHDIYITFDMSASDPWIAFYGMPEEDPEAPKKPELPKQVEKDKPKDQAKPELKEEHKEEPDQEKEEIPGQKNIDDYPECIPEFDEEQEVEETEVIEADIVEHRKTETIADRTLFESNELDISVYDGELRLLIKDLKNIQSIMAIDSQTGNIWEVTID